MTAFQEGLSLGFMIWFIASGVRWAWYLFQNLSKPG